MKKSNRMNLLVFSFFFILVLVLNGCIGTGTDFHLSLGNKSHPPTGKKIEKQGPPDHAKAYGRRAKYDYRYYPDAQVYFDINRRVYFHLGEQGWKMSVNLPYKIRLGGYVTIEMDTDKPYKEFKRHKTKYPPEHVKKKKNKWSHNR